MIVSVTTKKDSVKPVIKLLVKELKSKMKIDVDKNTFKKNENSYLSFSDAKNMIFKIDKRK